MLVYAKTPKGSIKIGAYRIYGIDMSQGPRDVPFELYEACKNGLEDATYREDFLKRIFGRRFPEIAFRYNEVRWLPDKTLDVLCSCMGISSDESWQHKRKVDAIKKAIRDASPA